MWLSGQVMLVRILRLLRLARAVRSWAGRLSGSLQVLAGEGLGFRAFSGSVPLKY